MRTEKIGATRRSALITTFGVGSLLAAQDDSVMICGLDVWRPGPPVIEPRLAASLGVQELRLPPTDRPNGDIPAVRFPEWAFCTDCRLLGPAWKLAAPAGRRCKACGVGTIVPSRFVACCRRGHIEDFPYWSWVHSQNDFAPHSNNDQLWLKARGRSSMLADLEVICSCGLKRSLAGAFTAFALSGVRSCSGRRPWLPGSPDEECPEPLRTLQRGSSNVWFGRTRSAISIPSVANLALDFVAARIGDWDEGTDAATLASALRPPAGCTREDLVSAINELRSPVASRHRPSEESLRAEEYQALVGSVSSPGTDTQFQCDALDLTDSGLPGFIAQISRVGRLREVRALHGFTRIIPGGAVGDDNGTPLAGLSTEAPTWLPAIEVLGEGIFLRIDEEALLTWESTQFAADRIGMLLRNQDLMGGSVSLPIPAITKRSLLMHSLAHILIDELALSSGYPAASLRERIFDSPNQAGILVYTATADSAGSLGGLAAQSHPDRLASLLRSALGKAQWCTTDPVCIESVAAGVDGLNLAACHACLLLPETSCERFNAVLDRATLVGLPDGNGRQRGGLFSDWLTIERP